MDKAQTTKHSAAVVAAAEKVGGMFVFATVDSNLLQAKNVSSIIAKFSYTEHKCNACSAEFAAPKAEGMHYHCVACGSDKTEATHQAVKPVIASDDSLLQVHCSACGTHNVLHAGVVASVNHLNCTTCGHSMNYKAHAAEGDEDLDLDDMETVDIEDDSSSETAAEDGQDMPSSPDGVNTNEDPSDKPLDMDSATTPAVAEQPGGSVAVEPAETRPVTLDLLQEFDSNKDEQLSPEGTQLSFVHVAGTFAIAAGTTIVATLTPEDAGERAEMMYTQQFASALSHSIKTLGLKEAAKQYNFKPATVTVNVEAEALKMATAKAEEAGAKITARLSEVAADFSQSLDIAAAGYAQNFWRNKQDPVKAALISEFSSLGIQSAAKIVDRIFASYGVQQVRDMLEQAREISALDVNGRNGLAKAINLASYLPTPATATAEDESDLESLDENDLSYDDSEEASLMQIAMPTTEAAAPVSKPSQYKSNELRSILGSHSLFSS